MKRITAALLALFIFLTPEPAMASIRHLVQRGDTLWLISQRYNIAAGAIVQANNLADPEHIEVGLSLVIPESAPVHVVRPGDTLWAISRLYNTTVDSLARANNISDVNLIGVGDRLLIAESAPAPELLSRGNLEFSASELDLFARLVHAEAAGEPFLGQVAVAASVLNRVMSPSFPNTLRNVIYQVVAGFYQYSPVLDGRINLPANESARRAVQEALAGQDPSLGATGFFNPGKTDNVWVRRQQVTTVISNHVFFR